MKSVNCNYLLNYILPLLNAGVRVRQRASKADRHKRVGQTRDSRLDVALSPHSSSSRQLFVCAEFKHFVELHLRRQRLTALFGVLCRVYTERYIWDFLFIFAYSSANPWSPCPKHGIDNISSGLDCSAPLRGGIRQIDNSLKRFVRHLKAE